MQSARSATTFSSLLFLSDYHDGSTKMALVILLKHVVVAVECPFRNLGRTLLRSNNRGIRPRLVLPLDMTYFCRRTSCDIEDTSFRVDLYLWINESLSKRELPSNSYRPSSNVFFLISVTRIHVSWKCDAGIEFKEIAPTDDCCDNLNSSGFTKETDDFNDGSDSAIRFNGSKKRNQHEEYYSYRLNDRRRNQVRFSPAIHQFAKKFGIITTTCILWR